MIANTNRSGGAALILNDSLSSIIETAMQKSRQPPLLHGTLRMGDRGGHVPVCDSRSQVLQYCSQCLQSTYKHLGKRYQEILSVNISHNGQFVTAWYYFLEAQHCYGISCHKKVSTCQQEQEDLGWLYPRLSSQWHFPVTHFLTVASSRLSCLQHDFSFGIHDPLQVFPHL